MKLNKHLSKEFKTGRYEMVAGGLVLPKSKIMIGGEFHHDVNGEDLQIDENIVVNEGLIYVINTAVAAVSQNASWFVAIFENNYTPVPADTAALFPGAGVAGEIDTEYDEGNRPAYTLDGSVLTNVSNSSSPASFTMNATINAYGAHMMSNNTKAGTTGTLLAAAKFSAVRALVNLDVLNVTYQLTIADA